jgi:lipopolysaccharide export LptBFGC system permease protein LptF
MKTKGFLLAAGVSLAIFIFSLTSCASAIEAAKEILDTPKKEKDSAPPENDNNEGNNNNNNNDNNNNNNDITGKKRKTAN